MKMFLMLFSFVFATMFSLQSFALGTVTVTKSTRQYGSSGKAVRVVKIHWVGDASAATVPSTDIAGMSGFLMKMVTDPGATAPTDNYDITLKAKNDGLDDCMNAAGTDRDTANTEVAFPIGASGTLPNYCQPDTYTFALSGNAVNSAIGDVYLYFVDSL